MNQTHAPSHDDSHNHPHPRDHEPDDDHAHGHDHSHNSGWWNALTSALHLPGYGHADARPGHGDALFNNELGIRTIRLALLALGVTTLLQVAVYIASGSVALLADTVHNLGDALNSIPLWIAFVLARRAANKRYTYGYGRAEDIAGLLIVLSIAFSAGYSVWESIQKFIHPQPLTNLGWVAAASVVGFIGNELVALMQIRVGRRIGSEAMVTDGLHARTDGFTSLAVLIAVGGAWLGYPIVDPIIGLLIGVAIVFIARDAIIAMWYRLMDAVDPKLMDRADSCIRAYPDVRSIKRLRMRWVGHSLHLDAAIAVEGNMGMIDAHRIVEGVSLALFHALPTLDDVTITPIPLGPQGEGEMAHHQH
jgi:cation diffusion facilitator family transporter